MDQENFTQKIALFCVPIFFNIFIKWFHISGASGIDGEGNNFTTIDEGEYQIIKKMIEADSVKIVEVWQGHLDNYYGFQNAIETLDREFNNG